MRIHSAGELANLVGGVCAQPETGVGPDVVIDSTLVTQGALFVALPGIHVDGHDFVEQAAQAGASAVLVTRDFPGICCIVVPDVLAGLERLAAHLVSEAKSNGMVSLALTGSSGKTSVKDLLAHVLRATAPTVAPVGNHNNEIGVPLTACAIAEETQFFVAELGARHVGDIKHLVSIVRPQHAAILNIGSAHIGEFGGREHTAQAKGEIIEDLPSDGWAVLNADDSYVVSCASRTNARICWFTTSSQVPGDFFVAAQNLVSDELERYSFDLVFHVDRPVTLPVTLKVIGAHQVSNALAAAALAHCAGISPESIVSALSTAEAQSRWRMELVQKPSGLLILNDSYNANPESMRAGLDTVAELGAKLKLKHPDSRTIAILGTMGELGEESESEHYALGDYAGSRVDELIAIGEYSEQLCAGYGVRARQLTFGQIGGLQLGAHDLVFLKASRSVGLEALVDQLGA